ncbi:MAG: PAQR family membrane homeostasis protein TrhA [Solirubrobacteraceae bacterium]
MEVARDRARAAGEAARTGASDAAGKAADAARAGADAARAQAEAALTKVKPRFRGVTHQYAFFVSLVVGVVLIAFAPTGEARLACAIYAFSVSGLFGTSALYHRITWSPRARRWMRRLDHAMIFVLIAGTYTPFALLALDGTFSTIVLVGVWGGALGGTVLQLAWIDSPKWLTAGVYVSLGCFAILAGPELVSELGVLAVVLVGIGGALYTAGAVVYTVERPDPAPAVFGYHEIFHVLTIAAALAQFAAIAFFVLPRA